MGWQEISLEHGSELKEQSTNMTQVVISAVKFDEFISYLLEFYGDGGLWTNEFFDPPLTKNEAESALSYRLMSSLYPPWQGDSVDRELVRNIAMRMRRNL